jgi:hypothetical protein
MFRLPPKASVCAALLVLASGCIEMTQTITLNPDGRGKAKYDILMPGDLDFNIGGAAGKTKTIDEKKRESAAKFLTKTSGLTAWRDVSVKWAPDGRLHIVATGYFDKLDDLSRAGDNMPGLSFGVTHQDGVMRIKGKPNTTSNDQKKPPVEPAKMTDKELDHYILEQRISYQTGKPLLVAMLSDLKVKTVIRLPGETVELKGFKKDGEHAVTFTLDGNMMLTALKKFMAQDNAAMKKILKEGNQAKLVESFGLADLAMEPEVAAKGGKDLFDYTKEVEAARAAYPKLREQFHIDPNKKLPGE